MTKVGEGHEGDRDVAGLVAQVVEGEDGVVDGAEERDLVARLLRVVLEDGADEAAGVDRWDVPPIAATRGLMGACIVAGGGGLELPLHFPGGPYISLLAPTCAASLSLVSRQTVTSNKNAPKTKTPRPKPRRYAS